LRQTSGVTSFGGFDGGLRFPDGVKFLGGSGDTVRLSVSMPLVDGYLGRECPECTQQFRIDHDDYEALPDDLVLWCVYCGHSDDHSEFLTQRQSDRLKRAARGYGMQLIGQMLDDTFGKVARSTGSNKYLKISYRSKPFYPEPLPDLDEESFVRERTCGQCQIRYAVFGEHRFCPVCGPLEARAVALDALAADETRLDVLSGLENDVQRQLREAGVLDRTYADTIENVVGAIEALAERGFHDRVSGAEALVRGKGKIFQRLNDFADLFADHAGMEVRTALGSTWTELEAAWAARHIFTHSDGIVDQKYLDQVPGSSLRVGQRLRATEALARDTIANAKQLVDALTSN
jgi:hypothetical protein